MLTVAFCSGGSPSAIGLLSGEISHLTGWSGLATENVEVGAAAPPEPLDFEQAARKAAMVGNAAAVAALLAKKARRLTPSEYGRGCWEGRGDPDVRGTCVSSCSFDRESRGSLPNGWKVA